MRIGSAKHDATPDAKIIPHASNTAKMSGAFGTPEFFLMVRLRLEEKVLNTIDAKKNKLIQVIYTLHPSRERCKMSSLLKLFILPANRL